jgi:hypothetical protein
MLSYLRRKLRATLLLIVLGYTPLSAEDRAHPDLPTVVINNTDSRADASRLRVLFWNVENLFDLEDNPMTADDEFLPSGVRHWTPRRYRRKLRNLAQVMVECGAWRSEAWHPAEVIALAEVENEGVLQDLLHQTPLGQLGYVPLITHSADFRGINVALMYRPDGFRLLGHEEWEIPMPEGKRATRHLLHVWGTAATTVTPDTLDFIVCHLPSRYGGVVGSIPSRQAAHRCLSSHIDSLEHRRTGLKLLVMGDMNDYPDTELLREDLQLQQPPLERQKSRHSTKDKRNKSLSQTSFEESNQDAKDKDKKDGMQSQANRQQSQENRLQSQDNRQQSHTYHLKTTQVIPTARYSLMTTLMARKKPTLVMGSHKYQGEWGFLDQFFTTGRLLETVQAWGVFAVPQMLTEDKTHRGVRPLRSYYGFQYEGGYSDHLPIIIDLSVTCEFGRHP